MHLKHKVIYNVFFLSDVITKSYPEIIRTEFQMHSMAVNESTKFELEIFMATVDN